MREKSYIDDERIVFFDIVPLNSKSVPGQWVFAPPEDPPLAQASFAPPEPHLHGTFST